MPVRLVPPSRNAAAEYLMKLYAETEQKLIREIARKRVQGYVDYAETAALTRVRRTLQEMVDKSGKYVPLAVEKEFYRDSAKHAAGYANARGMIQNPASTLAIEQLSDNLLGQVQEMAVTSYQSAAFLLGRPEADVFRELGIRNAAQVMALGKGALTATEAFVAQIEAHGITAFVDKAGRRWSLRAYGNMAVRTTVRQAQVSAVLTRDDHDLYKIVRHRAPCEVCAVYADRIYSKSGTNPNYPPLAQAFGKMDVAGPDDLSNTFLNIHPACMCSLVPWTELGKTPEEIQKARDRSSFEKNPADKEYRGKKEIEEYRQKERNRAELMRELKEWRAMRAAGISDVPGDFATFRRHYGDAAYQQWKDAFKPFKPKPAPKAPNPAVVTSTPAVVTSTPAPPPVVQRPANEQEVLKGFNVYDPSTLTPQERLAKVNPNYSQGGNWKTNCQRCVIANELVERGYDVTAQEWADDAIKSNGIAAWKFSDASWWRDPGVYLSPNLSGFKKTVEDAFDAWGDGSRAFLRIRWRNSKSAHFISAKRVGDEIIFSDPQENKYNLDFGELLKRASKAKNANWIMRVDNRELNELVGLAVKNAK